jgi:hypothetical protein
MLDVRFHGGVYWDKGGFVISREWIKRLWWFSGVG